MAIFDNNVIQHEYHLDGPLNAEYKSLVRRSEIVLSIFVARQVYFKKIVGESLGRDGHSAGSRRQNGETGATCSGESNSFQIYLSFDSLHL